MRKTETVEEFLTRGGKIQTTAVKKEITKPLRIKNDYSDREFENKLHDFYNSKEWRELRTEVKKELTNICPVCGSEENLVAEHIKPVRHFWEERLNKENIQLLCHDCNIEKGSMINWTLEWHLSNKKSLSVERVSIDHQKKREKQRREKVKDDESAFKGMPDYERKQLNSCYSSYLSRCKYKKIDPISKTKFRNYIEVQVSKFIENTWSQTGAIKNYIKNNCEKIQ